MNRLSKYYLESEQSNKWNAKGNGEASLTGSIIEVGELMILCGYRFFKLKKGENVALAPKIKKKSGIFLKG